ncbi:transposase [Paracoccus sp. S-4012]|uniref:transposase n=1 Tax=Paracoccus sp. S-4012 TaxID=2665648 RepID=UPI00351B7534
MHPIVIFDALRVKIRDADSRYTTNAVESLNRVLRKTLKTKGSFPTEEAATKLIYLAIRAFEKGGSAVRERVAARNQLAIMFGERFAA